MAEYVKKSDVIKIMEDMFHSSMVHHAYIGMNNYCNRCGQKLDWREKE